MSAQLEAARQAVGRWALLDAEVRSPKESLAVVSQVVTHLYADTRAVRVALQSMALIIPRKSGHPVTLHVQVDLQSAPLRPA